MALPARRAPVARDSGTLYHNAEWEVHRHVSVGERVCWKKVGAGMRDLAVPAPDSLRGVTRGGGGGVTACGGDARPSASRCRCARNGLYCRTSCSIFCSTLASSSSSGSSIRSAKRWLCLRRGAGLAAGCGGARRRGPGDAEVARFGGGERNVSALSAARSRCRPPLQVFFPHRAILASLARLERTEARRPASLPPD